MRILRSLTIFHENLRIILDLHSITGVWGREIFKGWKLIMSPTDKREALTAKKCSACEGKIEKLTPEQTQTLLSGLTGWQLTDEGRRIRKDWRMKDFKAAIEFIDRVAELAESEGHHPDLHLENYRNFWIELWTHSIGGLSENDFILAAKIEKIAP
jgi:4a-hydroxytetrahydrobiopterin dehydratase